MTPAELSAAIRACLSRSVADGELAVAVPAEIRVERPRQREHGDWATNVAIQLAKQAGRRRATSPSVLAARLSEVRGHQERRRRRPGFLNITLDAAAAGELARTIVEAGADYGTTDAAPGSASTSSSSPRTRPARCTSAASAGRPSATRSRRMLAGHRRRRHPRVLLQRPRRADRPVRPLAAGARRAASRRPRTATAAQYISEIADRRCSRRERPDAARAARRRGAGGLPRARRRADVRARSRRPCTTSASTSTSTSTRTRCTSPAPSSTPSPGCASSATSTRPTARSGCAPPTSATTRTASSSRATARRPTSPATSPTTSTSASAASTASSSCSAPTTTATSAG